MALSPLNGDNAFLAQALAIRDLPPEVQEQIRAQAEQFSEGDRDTIDTPNEMRALQQLLLGLDPNVVAQNPQLQQMQQFAQQVTDPMLLVEMIKNRMGENQNGGGGGGGGGGGLGNMLGNLGGNMFNNPMTSLGPNFGGGNGGGGGGGGVGTTPVSGPAQASYPAGEINGDRSQYAMDYLQQELGITREQAAGIVGNLAVESGASLDPTAIGDNGNARGIAQWNGPRKRALEAFAAQQGRSPDDFRLQLQFMVHELRTSESGALSALRGTNSAADAALVFSQRYERPGIPHNDRRMAYANQALAQYA